jgi:hypothetical protein
MMMTPIEWLLSGDTGTSSKTICAVMTGSNLGGDFDAGVPHDPSDFGRCYRLLRLFPGWIERLDEVALHYPMWTGLVREWGELTAMYKEELAEGTENAPRLYRRMKVLIDEGRVAAGMTQTSPGCWSSSKRTLVELGGATVHFSGYARST